MDCRITTRYAFFYDLPVKNTVSEITSDPTLVQAIETAYDIVNFPTFITKMDGWVGGLAEDHQPGSSVGQLFEFILLNQFERLRDGDRLFYLSDDLGLYSDISSGPVLLPSIRDIIDLDNFSLSDVIKNNTTITNISDNVFFAAIPGDFDGNHLVNDADLAIWNASYGVGAGADSDGDGDTDGYDLQIWQQYFGGGPASSVSQAVVVPEPASSLLLALALLAFSPLRPAISSAQSISPAP